jgi:sulfate permease, SulP family
MNALKKYLPIAGWLPSYQLGWLRFDLIAGLTLWGILVPEAIAYAGMAGAPAQAGLYALIFSLPLFALFGTSRQLAVAATSSTSIMIAAVIAPVMGDNPEQYSAMLAALVVSVGAIFLLAGLLRLGFISSFLSEPVMTGFVFGLAIYIAVHQLPKIFGVSSGEGDTLQQFWHIVTNLGDANWYAFAVGAGAIALLFLLHRFAPRVPGALVALVLGILAVTIFDLATNHSVAIVGKVDGGLPSFVVPDVSRQQFMELLSGAFGIALVGLAEALGAARTFADKYDYKIDVNQEMIAIGAGNVAAGFFGGLAVGGGMSSSTVNDQAGARTQVSSLVAAAMGLVTLLVLMPLFKNLPEAVLGAIVIHAVMHLMKVKELRRFYKLRRFEFALAVVALAGVVTLDILPGLLLAVVLSLLLLIWKASLPVGTALGRVPGEPGAYSSVERHPGNQPVEGLTIFRFDVPLFFANASQLHDRLGELMKADPPPQALLIDLQSSTLLDVSSTDMLLKLVTEAQAKNVTVMFCEVIEPVRQSFEKAGIAEKLGEGRIFHTVDEGVRAYLRTRGKPQADG